MQEFLSKEEIAEAIAGIGGVSLWTYLSGTLSGAFQGRAGHSDVLNVQQMSREEARQGPMQLQQSELLLLPLR